MRGLLVVGASHAADPHGLAEALAGVLQRAGEPAEARSLIAAAAPACSPLTAAAHRGATLDPATLRGRATSGSSTAVLSVAGGLLAPLTPRYAVRHLASELALPLVVALAPDGDAVNLARLTGEAARGAGLVVAAFVFTGWPDPPSRIQLDERRLLADLAGAGILALPDRGAARDDALRRWNPMPWLDARAAAAGHGADGGAGDGAGSGLATAPAVRAELVLDPYDTWSETPLGDPRDTPRPVLMDALKAIIAAEGPMLASRAYAIYNRASGGRKLTSIARAPLSSAVYWLAREQQIVLVRAEDVPWQEDDIVRLPDAPAVRVRELGPRTLDEVPLDEIAELMRRIRATQGVGDPAGLKRAVLDAYGLKRLTARADEYLGLALGLLD